MYVSKPYLSDQVAEAIRVDAFRKSSFSGPYSDNCVELAELEGGGVALRDSTNPTGPVLAFTADEWKAFRLGIKNEEFDPR